MSKQFLTAICGLTLIASAGLVAQRGTIRPGNTGLVAPTFAERWRPANLGGQTLIIGTVIDIGMVPVANTRVQLRSLVNGTVQQATTTNENGEYTFEVEDPGTFVVEMSLTDGQVIALSNAGTLARYETLRTVIQLPGRWDSSLRAVVMPQNAVNFVGLGSANTMTQTTLTAAVDQNITPINPGVPVSAISPRQ
jgi:SdrD B-like domain